MKFLTFLMEFFSFKTTREKINQRKSGAWSNQFEKHNRSIDDLKFQKKDDISSNISISYVFFDSLFGFLKSIFFSDKNKKKEIIHRGNKDLAEYLKSKTYTPEDYYKEITWCNKTYLKEKSTLNALKKKAVKDLDIDGKEIDDFFKAANKQADHLKSIYSQTIKKLQKKAFDDGVIINIKRKKK